MESTELVVMSALLAAVLLVISYLLVYKSNKNTKRNLQVYLAGSWSILLFLYIILFFCIFKKYSYILAFIGGITAYWRYELSKYNDVARGALNEFTEIFQQTEFGSEEDIRKLSCILMTLATFNTTNAWNEAKCIINRFPKTPRYFGESTMIVEAINKDNGIRAIIRFLPLCRSLIEDQNYKKWLDQALELLRSFQVTMPPLNAPIAS